MVRKLLLLACLMLGAVPLLAQTVTNVVYNVSPYTTSDGITFFPVATGAAGQGPPGGQPIPVAIWCPITGTTFGACNIPNTSSTSPQVFNGPITTPSLLVSKTYLVTPQTVRGIVGAFAGASTSNGTAWMDVFPFGYNPWATGIRFQDGATDTGGSAIEIGVTADGVSSQHIRFYSLRAPTFDSVFDMFMKGGTLIFAGGLALGQPGVSGCYENAYASRFCYDATNGNALVHAGGSVIATNLGIGFTSGATAGATYWGMFDKSGNFGVGPQRDETISNVALNNPFSVAGPAQAVPGAVKAPSVTQTGLPTGCPGIPCTVGFLNKSGQTATFGSTAIATSVGAGYYRVCGSMFVNTTTMTSGTISLSYTTTINGNGISESHTLVGNATATVPGSGGQGCTGPIFSGAGATFSLSSAFNALTGGVITYQGIATVELMHL